MSYALYWRANSRYEDPRAGVWTGFKFYPSFLPTLVRAHHVVFPDFELRLHHDGCIETCYYGQTLVELERRGLVRLIHSGPAESLCKPMLWRLAPIWSGEPAFVFCRDVDALPTPRERLAVEEFMVSGAVVHAIYDHPQHGHGLCGGMIGFHAARFCRVTGLRSLEELLDEGASIDLDVPGGDQDLLNAEVLPAVESRLLRHRDLPRVSEGLDALTPCIGLGYARAPVLEYCQGKGRTAEIEEVERLTNTPPLIEAWS